MFDKIINFENIREVYRLLMNTQLAIRTDEVSIDIAWLGYNFSGLTDRLVSENAGMHRHSFYEIHLCLNGHSEYQVRDKQYAIKPGQMILIALEEPHYLIHKSRDYSKIALGFSIIPKSDDLSGKLIGALSRSEMLLSDRTEEIAECFYEILIEFSEQKLGYLAAAKAQLTKIIMICARLCGEPATQPDFSQRVDQRIAEINLLIQNQMGNRVSGQDIADNVHLSVRQINRIIQNAYGMPLSAYIERVKCSHAKNILLYSDTPIREIAIELGYANEFSFNKFFKRVEGMPPGQFRRSRFV